MSTAIVAQDTSWLDVVPGARSAYEYIESKIAEFYFIGTNKVPAWNRALRDVAPIVQASNDSTLIQRMSTVSGGVGYLDGLYRSTEQKITSVVNSVRSITGQGGTSNVDVSFAVTWPVATAILAVVGGLYLFFHKVQQQESDLCEFVQDLVNRKMITPQKGVEMCQGLYQDGLTGALGKLGSGLGLAGLAVLAYFVLRRR